jgi:hypothetical protein
MPKNVAEIMVGANGVVRVAPTTEAIPTSVDDAYSAGWVDLGYCDENGVKFEDQKKIDSILVWQSLYPGRRVVSSRDFAVTFALRQFAGEQVKFAFGGGIITASGDDYKYVPPDPEDLDERRLSVEWFDGTKTYRLMVPAGMVSDNVATNLVRAKASDLPIVFSVMAQDGIEPWYILTDDAGFAEGT